MEIPSWLAISGAVVGLFGGTAGLVSATVNAFSFRTASIEKLRTDLTKFWTNEGDIASPERLFITLNLELKDGDIFGTLSTNANAHKRLLEAHLDVHWRSAILTVSELYGRTVEPVAIVRVRLKGNRNRLKWTVISGNERKLVPNTSLLWPTTRRNSLLPD